MVLRIMRFEIGAGFLVRLWLSDGGVVDVDLTGPLEQPAFAEVRTDRGLYEQVRLSPGDGALSWPGGLDLDIPTLLNDERSVYHQLGQKFAWDGPEGTTLTFPDGRVWTDGHWREPAADTVSSGLDWLALWTQVAARMAAHWEAGRGHLLTEDTLRMETVLALEAFEVAPAQLTVEVPAPELAGGKLDLVVEASELAVVELKYPRDSKTGISPDTMTFGELLRDFLRVAVVPAGERWVVQLLNDRLVQYLAGAYARYGLHWASSAGGALRLPATAIAALPKTAGQAIGAAVVDGTVTATCVLAAPVATALSLYAYRVDQAPVEVTEAAAADVDLPVAPVPVAVATLANRNGARQEILDAARAVVIRAGRPEFSMADVIAEMRRRGTGYAESTIRTMIASHLCAESTGSGVAAYRDLTRVRHGLYRLTEGAAPGPAL